MSERLQVAERLAAHVFRTQWQDLPGSAREAVKTFVLDSIGVGLSGSRVAETGPLIALLRGWGEGDDARVWGSGQRLPAASAAMINGWQIHNQEFDCVHEGAVVHPMATILSAVVAWCERRGGVDGAALITALALAVDVATVLGLASRSPVRFFRPAVCGGIGAAAALARLAGLDEQGIRRAMGFAYSQACGTMQAHVEGSPVLPLQIAFNARNALLAVDLAVAGLHAPVDVFEGPFGFFTLFEPESEPAAALAQLGEVWQIEQVSHKPFPTGRAAHGGIDALAGLMAEHGFGRDEIARMDLWAPPLVLRLVARPVHDGMNPAYAKLCLQYILACYLLDGEVGVAAYEPQRLRDPARQALGRLLTLHPNGIADPNALAPQRFAVALHDGRVFERDLPAVLGHPARPLGRERSVAKFRRCCADAAGPLSAATVEALIDNIAGLETLPDVRRLVDLTRFET